jgi:hypothetical protein
MNPIKIAFVISCFLAGSAFAQEDIPAIVSSGLDAYKKSGGKAALAVWLKGSSLESDTSTGVKMIGILNQIEAAYGKMIGFEKIRLVPVSPSLIRAYVLMKYEKGPLYAAFDCYKTEAGWVIPQVDFNTKASAVLPESFLVGPKL